MSGATQQSPAPEDSGKPSRRGSNPPELRAPKAAQTSLDTKRTAHRAPNSVLQKAVDALRAKILATTTEDAFIGSESQLIEELGVSRPTFRQAARLLEHEQLLKIKRGIKGGFFAQPPSADAVSRMASFFLNARGTTLAQISDATAPMFVEAARLVASNPDIAIRRQLKDFLDEHTDDFKHPDNRHAFRSILRFERLLGHLSGNPAVQLMIDVMRDLVRSPRHGYFVVDGERMGKYLEFSQKLSEAVLEGDPELAALITRRHTEEIRGWLPADVKLDQ